MRLRSLAACALLAAAAGCGGEKFAPVSGVITVDGKPYGKAVISFQPMGDKDNPNPGRGSSANTDENGRFVLKSDNATEGAIVGKHLVRIRSRSTVEVSDEPSTGSPDGTPVGPRQVEEIPVEWRVPGKEFVVPEGGTDQANFDIKTKKP